MITHHRIAWAVLLCFVGYVSPAAARGSQSSNDPPWNAEHISAAGRNQAGAHPVVRRVSACCALLRDLFGEFRKSAF